MIGPLAEIAAAADLTPAPETIKPIGIVGAGAILGAAHLPAYRAAGIPVPAMSNALSYYDSYRSARLPANMLQAQRDYFGAHTYERVDKPRGEFFHTEWLDLRKAPS